MFSRLNTQPLLAFLMCAWLVLPGLLPPLGERGATIAVSDILGGLTLMYCFVVVTQSPMRIHIPDVALFVYLSVVAFSCLFYIGDRNTLLLLARATRLLFIFSPAFLFLVARLDIEAIRYLLRLYVASATIGIAIPLAAYAMGMHGAMANQTIDLDAVGVVNRAGGWIGDSSAFGHQISCLSLVLILGLLSGVLEFKVVYLASFAVILYGLYATSSRTALVTIVITTALFLFFGPSKIGAKLRSIFLLGLISGLAALFISVAYSSGHLQGLGNVIDKLLTPFELVFDAGRAAQVSSGRLENWGGSLTELDGVFCTAPGSEPCPCVTELKTMSSSNHWGKRV